MTGHDHQPASPTPLSRRTRAAGTAARDSGDQARLEGNRPGDQRGRPEEDQRDQGNRRVVGLVQYGVDGKHAEDTDGYHQAQPTGPSGSRVAGEQTGQAEHEHAHVRQVDPTLGRRRGGRGSQDALQFASGE